MTSAFGWRCSATLVALLGVLCGCKSLQVRPPPIAPPLIRFETTASELESACQAAEAACEGRLSVLASLGSRPLSFDNTVGAYERAVTAFRDATQPLVFLQTVHPEETVRAAALACDERGRKYLLRVAARADLYSVLKRYSDHRTDASRLDAQDTRLIELTLHAFQNSGVQLAEEKRAELVSIRSELADAEARFSDNLAHGANTVELSPAELTGLPPSFVSRLTRKGDAFLISTHYPDYYAVMENAASESARKRMELSFDRVAVTENLPLLRRALVLRARAARLLGFGSHAEATLGDRMVRSPATVLQFLSGLDERLRSARDSLNSEMLALKRKQTGDPFARLEMWDWRYFLAVRQRQNSGVDEEHLRSYFPLEHVEAGLFRLCETLFHVTISKMENAPVWASGVKLYQVREAADGHLLALFYTDLLQRDGKTGLGGGGSLVPGHQINASFQVPLGTLSLSFVPAAPGQPTLLSLREVETLFHEMGHVLHGALTTARYSSLAVNVPIDFVEAPAELLARWVYQPQVLSMITADPADPSKKIHPDLAKKLFASRHRDAGVFYTRQVYLAMVDLLIHSSLGVDPDAVEQRLRGEIMGYPVDPSEHSVAQYLFLMGGYDVGYYGYLWSEVLAADMFTRFERKGVMDRTTGAELRDIVFAPGGAEPADQLVRRFLRRAPTAAAWFKELDLPAK